MKSLKTIVVNYLLDVHVLRSSTQVHGADCPRVDEKLFFIQVLPSPTMIIFCKKY